MFDQVISVGVLSMYQIFGDVDFKNALEEYGWTTELRPLGQGVAFYNESGNVSLYFEQKGNVVEVSIISEVHTGRDRLTSQQFSFDRDAIGVSIRNIREYADYNILENMDKFSV